LVKTTPRLIDQHIRREFSYKKEETLAANKTPGTARLLKTISKAIVVPKPVVVRKEETSETGSSYSDRVAEEMQRRLERKTKVGPVVEELPKDPEPEEKNDSLNESFNSE
jgi:hypothetical protein